MALATATLATSSARAAVPAILPFQGYLTDASGAPIDATLPIVFTIYDNDLAGTALFTETQSLTIDKGFINVYLGIKTTLNPAIFDGTKDLYLGIKISGDVEMVPRTQIGSVPYAFFAKTCGDATTLGGQDASSFAAAGASVTQVRVTGSCGLKQYIRTINQSGTVVCGDDANTTYSATSGGGLVLNGSSFALDPAVDGAGLLLAGGVLRVAPDTGSCATGQIFRYTAAGSGSWKCDNEVSYSAAGGGGLSVNASNAFSIATGGVGLAALGSLPSGNEPVAMSLASGTNDLLPNNAGFVPSANANCMVNATFWLDWTGSQLAPTDYATLWVLHDAAGTLSTGKSRSVALPIAGQTMSTTASAAQVFSVAQNQATRFGCRVTTGSATNSSLQGSAAECNVSWVCF